MTLVHLMLRYTHISMGMLGLLSGAASMMLPKGSPQHRRAGNVFFVSMLLMSGTGTFISIFITPIIGNIMGGSLTFYLVLTAWITVWRKPRETGWLEVGGALLGLSIAIAGIRWGLMAADAPRHTLGGYKPGLYYTFAGVALLATLLDVRMIAHGGFAGTQRTTRHLWRMCTAMLIATLSFFLGQAKLFPVAVRQSGMLPIPVLMVLGAFLYFLIRIRIWPLLRKLRVRRLAGERAL